MSIKNLYFQTDRTAGLNTAGEALKVVLVNLQAAGNGAEFYTNAQVVAAVPEIQALGSLTVGEIHTICNVAGVEYIHD